MKKERFFELVRLVLSGLIGTVLGYITLWILKEYFGMNYMTASEISFTLSYLVSFILQKYWTFKNKSTLPEFMAQLILYFGMAFIFFSANKGMMSILVEQFHIHYLVSQLITLIVIAVLSLFTTKMIFKKLKNPAT